ncbi:hypothetical protein HW555_011421 [Spodoptera exigua]|uniref:Uncharacterized protein n=1 Tax=Spodoptera exigua TaxID=7107 RepID=A0A835G724_SPOEX|nr:hypothetical protein HW555_011421 [Spodoptera exigua]
MGKAGRKPIVEKSKQREVFMKYADKLLDVKLRDPIFDTIASDLDNLMTPAALYMSLKRNFREFLNTECLKESKQNLDNLLNSHKYADFKNVDQNEEFEYDQIVIDDAGVRDIVAWFDLLVDNEKKSNPANSYVVILYLVIDHPIWRTGEENRIHIIA